MPPRQLRLHPLALRPPLLDPQHLANLPVLVTNPMLDPIWPLVQQALYGLQLHFRTCLLNLFLPSLPVLCIKYVTSFYFSSKKSLI